MLADAIRYNRTDVALVRIITPIGGNEQVADARDRAIRFTAHMTPYLSQFVPN